MKFLTFIAVLVTVVYFLKPNHSSLTEAPTPQKADALPISSGPTEEQKIANEAAETARCRDDLKCTAEKFEIEARIRCAHEIEQRAKYDFKWTKPGLFGAYGQIFESYSWANKAAQIIDYSGDKVQYQNGFGAFMRMSYVCTFNTVTKEVKNLSVSQGRL